MDGTGTVIAIIDTKIDRTKFARKKIAFDATAADFACSDILVINCPPDVSAVSTDHGTVCSAVVVGVSCETGVISRGVAPGAKLIVYQIPDQKDCYTDAILNALQDIQNGFKNGIKVDVVSLSYGCNENRKDKIHKKIDELTKLGVIFVAAAGNRGYYQPHACIPARFDNVISVGALDGNGKVAPYTPPVELDAYAPGEYQGYEGTSYAAPAVAGLVLLLKQWADFIGSPAKENINRVDILRKIFTEDMFVRSDSRVELVDTLQPTVKVDDDGTICIFQPVDFFMNIKDRPEQLNVIVQKHMDQIQIQYSGPG